jgi:putative OPT family oligopeptide transporter
MASDARGMFGGKLPWTLVWIGAAIGAVIIAIDEVQKKRGSSFRVPVLAAAVGIYLPMEYTAPIFIGGLITHLVERVYGKISSTEEGEKIHRKGVLFSAGLITGEALVGILMALPIVISKRADVLALPESMQLGEWLGLALFVIVGYIMYRVGLRGARTARG